MRKNERVIRRLKKQVDDLEKEATSLNREDLLDIVATPSSRNIPDDDLQRVIREGQSSGLFASHSASAIMEHKKFNDWLNVNESAVLFIEGALSSASYGRITPMSTLSSLVLGSLCDKEPAIAIHFFCGFHTASQDPMRGPQGMMRSLICQILQLFTVEVDFVSRRVRDKLDILDLHTLCLCVGKLVRRLPPDTVLFCIIDSICFLENKEWPGECVKAVHDFRGLADDEDLVQVFKLLITSPFRSRHTASTLPVESRLLLPAEGLSGRGGPTEREISMRNRRALRGGENRSSLQSGVARSPDAWVADSSDCLSDDSRLLDLNVGE